MSLRVRLVLLILVVVALAAVALSAVELEALVPPRFGSAYTASGLGDQAAAGRRTTGPARLYRSGGDVERVPAGSAASSIRVARRGFRRRHRTLPFTDHAGDYASAAPGQAN